MHLNQQAEQWLKEEADQRMQSTVKEVVAVRFEREFPCLKPLPARRYDTSYRESRQASWDSYIDVRGNRYSVPSRYAGQRLAIRIGPDESLRVYADGQLVANHLLCEQQQGWVTVPEHHAALWKSTLQVERRSLDIYEEAASWS